MAIRNDKNPNFENETLYLGILGKTPFECSPCGVTENIIKWKVVASPKSKLW
jgi:hypothetical protein